MERPVLQLRITKHIGQGNKWDFDYYGNKERSANYGTTYRYQHAKFRLPSGKPKCLRFIGDDAPEIILAQVQKKYTNFSFILESPNLPTTLK